MQDFSGLIVPRYVINQMCGWRRLGPNIESYFGLAAPGTTCIPDYSVVVSEQDGGPLLMQLMAIFGEPPKSYARNALMLS